MEDAQIVELYWRRSADALAETDKKYGRLCRAVAGNILADPADAEETVNDTWLAAWNSMPDNRPAALGPYLGRIARNLALSRLRKQRRVKRGGGETPLALETLAECLPGQEDPQRETERRELSRAVDAFLRALPDTERQVFVCRYWYAAAPEEIAGRFGFSRSKTVSMLFRTRKKLRSALEKEGLL